MSNLVLFSKISGLLLILDFIFLSFIYKKFDAQITKIQGSPIKLNITGAILCYICLIYMLYYFIIKDDKSVSDAFILGLCTYGVYEFTSLSVLKGWCMNIALIDTLWGGTLFALTTYIIKSKYI